MTYWTVPREWPGETIFVLAGGPSLRGFDSSPLAGRRVIAINNSWELKPDCDVLHFCDRRWWDPNGLGHGERVKAGFTGRWITTVAALVHDPAVKRLRQSMRESGVSEDPSALVHGGHGGYQAIGLAFLFGAKRIVLLGYDMRSLPLEEAIPGDGTHWHHGHSGQRRDHFEHRLRTCFLPSMRRLVEPLARAGVEVLNATPDSALDCWPRVRLEETL